jgi:hypothetical protein
MNKRTVTDWKLRYECEKQKYMKIDRPIDLLDSILYDLTFLYTRVGRKHL